MELSYLTKEASFCTRHKNSNSSKCREQRIMSSQFQRVYLHLYLGLREHHRRGSSKNTCYATKREQTRMFHPGLLIINSCWWKKCHFYYPWISKPCSRKCPPTHTYRNNSNQTHCVLNTPPKQMLESESLGRRKFQL